jgi:MFS family permease
MIVIALVQIQLGFNVNALVISMGAIVDDLGVSATSVGTALVIYSLAVAGLVMLGSKIGTKIGSLRAFQIGVLVQGGSMGVMALSTSATLMNIAQLAAGIAAALVVPALVVLIAAHYNGGQQEQALGFLGAAQASSSALAFLIVGFMSVVISWRWAFALLVVLAVVNLVLSTRLKAVESRPDLRIDWVGALLAAAAVTLVSLGLDSVNAWGLLVAEPDAPFAPLGLSPSLILIVLGVLCGQAFFAWLYRRRTQQKSQILALEVLDTGEERAATFSLLIIAALGSAVNFLIPLYIQIVQGRSSLQTAVAIVPYALAVLIGAMFIVRLYGRMAPRQIGWIGFLTVAVGLNLLAYTIQSDWGTPLVILSLLIIGLGEGALLTLMFNVLVSASPKELAGHVGALRGTVNNLATGLGTALAGLLAVAALSILITGSVAESPAIPPGLIDEIADELELDDIDFVPNDELADALDETNATPDQAEEVVRINSAARLDALKISFQVLAALALLGVVPASRLPPYRPGEVPAISEEETAQHPVQVRPEPSPDGTPLPVPGIGRG